MLASLSLMSVSICDHLIPVMEATLETVRPMESKKLDELLQTLVELFTASLQMCVYKDGFSFSNFNKVFGALKNLKDMIDQRKTKSSASTEPTQSRLLEPEMNKYQKCAELLKSLENKAKACSTDEWRQIASHLLEIADAPDVNIFCTTLNTIESVFKNADDPAATFKDFFVVHLQKAVKKLPKLDQIAEHQATRAELVAQAVGGLYLIGWIGEAKLTGMMDRISANNFATSKQLEIFLTLLKLVQSEMIRKKEVGKSKSYIDQLKSARDSGGSEVTRLRCIEILNKILNSPTGNAKRTEEHFDKDLRNLSDENVDGIALKIKKNFSPSNIDRIVEEAHRDHLICAKLIVKIRNASPVVKELLKEKCLQELESSCKKAAARTISIAKFIAQLYLDNVFANADMARFLVSLLESHKSGYNARVGVAALLVLIGEKWEKTKDKELINSCFGLILLTVSSTVKEKKFEFDASFKANIFQYLIRLRADKWKHSKEIAEPILSHFWRHMTLDHTAEYEERFKQTVEEALMIAPVIVPMIIEKIWENIMRQPSVLNDEFLKKIVDVVKLKDFNPSIEKFLQARSKTFRKIPQNQFTRNMQRRLGHAILFVIKLYKLDVVSCELMTAWLHESLTLRLSLVDMAQTIAVVEQHLLCRRTLAITLKIVSLEAMINIKIDEEICALQQDIKKLKKRSS